MSDINNTEEHTPREIFEALLKGKTIGVKFPIDNISPAYPYNDLALKRAEQLFSNMKVIKSRDGKLYDELQLDWPNVNLNMTTSVSANIQKAGPDDGSGYLLAVYKAETPERKNTYASFVIEE